MDERVRKALSRELSWAESRIETCKAQVERLESELAQAREDLITADAAAGAFRDMLTVRNHAHTIDKFSGTFVVPASTSGYRPDRDAFSETEIAHMMGVV